MAEAALQREIRACSYQIDVLGEYLAYWLKEVVIEPDYAPQTVSIYEIFHGLYIIPGWET